MNSDTFFFPIMYLEKHFKCDFSSCCYGWKQKSVSFKVKSENNTIFWAKISIYTNFILAKEQKNSIESTKFISLIQKPNVHKTFLVSLEGLHCLITVMDYIGSPNFSDTPVFLNLNSAPTEKFLKNVKDQLAILSSQKCTFQAFSQELITRRIEERAEKKINTTLKKWCTVHGDLHWSNIKQDGTLIDWENWGIGPEGIDIAFLYAFSLLNKDLKNNIEKVFAEYFEENQFLICLLFVCSELIRMINVYNDYPFLYDCLLMLERNIYKKII